MSRKSGRVRTSRRLAARHSSVQPGTGNRPVHVCMCVRVLRMHHVWEGVFLSCARARSLTHKRSCSLCRSRSLSLARSLYCSLTLPFSSVLSYSLPLLCSLARAISLVLSFSCVRARVCSRVKERETRREKESSCVCTCVRLLKCNTTL